MSAKDDADAFFNEARRRIAGMRVLDTETVDAFRDGFSEGFRAGIEAAAAAAESYPEVSADVGIGPSYERPRSVRANIARNIRALRPDGEGG